HPDDPECRCWKPYGELGDKVIWQRKAEIKESSYYVVAIGASITSAARAYLFDALQRADDPVYCDTDSIVCKHLQGPLDATKLGAWKLEAQGDAIAIAGKKMYALFNGDEC